MLLARLASASVERDHVRRLRFWSHNDRGGVADDAAATAGVAGLGVPLLNVCKV